jgi:hypothetical protein
MVLAAARVMRERIRRITNEHGRVLLRGDAIMKAVLMTE